MSDPLAGVSMTDALFGGLLGESCPRPGCDGRLERHPYKGSDAVICNRCAVPAVRLWGDA